MMKLVLTLALSAISGDVAPSIRPTSTAPNLAFNTEFYDRSRERRIPVAIYGATGTPKPLAVISPGWDEPYRSAHTAYGFMAEYLVRQGFVVAAIQHQLPSDPTPPSVGNLAVLRRPYWEAGVANILHVDGVLRGLGVVDTKAAILVGHSHGGDISMLLATLHPEFADAVFTLDNRRMAIPRAERPRICSVRSGDMQADEGVFPDPKDQRGMIIVRVEGLRHNDITDAASPAQKTAMLEVLQRCLRRTGVGISRP